jgi:hypothetical protein
MYIGNGLQKIVLEKKFKEDLGIVHCF